MIYSEFINMVKPFYLTRGINFIGGSSNLYKFIHVGLQSAWNYANWSFKKVYEEIEPTEFILNGTTVYTYETNENFNKIDYITDSNEEPMKNKKDYFIYLNGDLKKIIYTKNRLTKICITYAKKYNWINLTSDSNVQLPFPDDFVPALINKVFDVSSPLLSFEGERTPAYAKAEKELAYLFSLDGENEQGNIIYGD